MSQHATVIVTDLGFLVPSLVVAEQIFAQANDITDIIVYLVDVSSELASSLIDSFPNLRFHTLSGSEYGFKDNVHFREGHVPPATIARLVLGSHLPDRYTDITYIDGDTQITGDIRPFLLHRPANGAIGVGRGSPWLKAGRNPSWDHQYLSGLNNVSADRYFNAGVLQFSRQTWLEIGPSALQFFFDHSHSCVHHDQSALNAVCKDRTEFFSPLNNFHTSFAQLIFKGDISPRIVHFTGRTKPWVYTSSPWGRRFAKPYVDILEKHAFLRPFLQVSPINSTVKQAIRESKMWVKSARSIQDRISNGLLLKRHMLEHQYRV
ncbi:glycosyltransferase family 8 protein [Agrobacterium larrymoorei]|uniref:Glycosyltransferase n=1 Tax=Agrobacterium larrymoorei TaxID=160699 RepID=A0AAF0HA27_9HYPH|nr:glycosyltransferase [Agrobacterium larrymoorei]WHA43219.1 glycosyltransferase [Agrobacterium larrymoorei]